MVVNIDEIEQQQDEFKQNILLTVKENKDMYVTIVVDDICRTITNNVDTLSALFENVWIRHIDTEICGQHELRIDAYSKDLHETY